MTTIIATDNSGDVGIRTTTPNTILDVNGNISDENQRNCTGVNTNSNGTFVCASSDERIKQNIEPLASTTAIAQIEELQPITFTYKDPTLAQGAQLGFLAQDVQELYPGLVATSSYTTPWTPDGTLTLNYDGLIAPLVAAVQDIANITSTFQQNLIAWLGNAQNGIASLYAGIVHATQVISTEDDTQTLCITNGPNDPTPLCVTKAQLAALLSQTASAATPESVTSSTSNIRDLSVQNPTPTSPESVTSTTSAEAATDTPPIIQVNGSNPAIIQVGNTYNDLGATITGPQQDLNLGIQTYVNGVAMSPIQIDTTEAATDTIDYVATDQSGLTSTSTRTVLIEPSASPAAGVFVATTTDATATTTNATSTSQ